MKPCSTKSSRSSGVAKNVVLIIAGHGGNLMQARQQARRFGFPIYAFPNEKSLDAWRRR